MKHATVKNAAPILAPAHQLGATWGLVRVSIFTLCLLAACNDSPAPAAPTPSVTGHWSGQVLDLPHQAAVSLDLVQTGTTVTGTGTWIQGGIQVPATVQGTYTTPNLAATLTRSTDGTTLVTWTAVHSNNTLSGPANDGGNFSNASMTLVRPP